MTSSVTLWIVLAAGAAHLWVGNVLLGHFEEHTAKWRRLLKGVIYLGLALILAATAGTRWAIAWLIVLPALGLTVQVWWTRKHGIDPITAEPKEKYYALRGWR